VEFLVQAKRNIKRQNPTDFFVSCSTDVGPNKCGISCAGKACLDILTPFIEGMIGEMIGFLSNRRGI